MEGCRIVTNIDEKKPTIYIDADACPVKKEIVEIASSLKWRAIFVASYTHHMQQPVGETWVYVDPDRESADLYLLNHVKTNDVVITQDIGLASLLLPKGVYVISPLGTPYDESTITTALDIRYLAAKARRQGIFGKGPAPFKKSDRERFRKNLLKFLSNIAGK